MNMILIDSPIEPLIFFPHGPGTLWRSQKSNLRVALEVYLPLFANPIDASAGLPPLLQQAPLLATTTTRLPRAAPLPAAAAEGAPASSHDQARQPSLGGGAPRGPLPRATWRHTIHSQGTETSQTIPRTVGPSVSRRILP